MNFKKTVFVFLLFLMGFTMLRANEFPKTKPADMPMIKFNFNDYLNNQLDKINNDAVKLKNFGASFFITGAVCTGASVITCLSLGVIYAVVPVFPAPYILIPATLIPVFGFMLVLGIMIMSNSWMYIKKGKIYDKIETVKKTGIIMSAIFGPLTLMNIAGGLLYYFFFYNLLANESILALSTVFLVLSCISIPFLFFMVSLPMLITGFVFSKLKKRVSTVSYLDTGRFAFTNGFSIKL